MQSANLELRETHPRDSAPSVSRPYISFTTDENLRVPPRITAKTPCSTSGGCCTVRSLETILPKMYCRINSEHECVPFVFSGTPRPSQWYRMTGSLSGNPRHAQGDSALASVILLVYGDIAKQGVGTAGHSPCPFLSLYATRSSAYSRSCPKIRGKKSSNLRA